MNAHFPQNELARAEAYNIGMNFSVWNEVVIIIVVFLAQFPPMSSTWYQRMALHLVDSFRIMLFLVCLWLWEGGSSTGEINGSGCINPQFINSQLISFSYCFRSDYMQLVFSALPRFHGYFRTLPPCMWKPEMLWSGKQVVSTVLLNIIPASQDKLNLTSRTKIAPKVCICLLSIGYLITNRCILACKCRPTALLSINWPILFVHGV